MLRYVLQLNANIENFVSGLVLESDSLWGRLETVQDSQKNSEFDHLSNGNAFFPFRKFILQGLKKVRPYNTPKIACPGRSEAFAYIL